MAQLAVSLLAVTLFGYLFPFRCSGLSTVFLVSRCTIGKRRVRGSQQRGIESEVERNVENDGVDAIAVTKLAFLRRTTNLNRWRCKYGDDGATGPALAILLIQIVATVRYLSALQWISFLLIPTGSNWPAVGRRRRTSLQN